MYELLNSLYTLYIYHVPFYHHSIHNISIVYCTFLVHFITVPFTMITIIVLYCIQEWYSSVQ